MPQLKSKKTLIIGLAVLICVVVIVVCVIACGGNNNSTTPQQNGTTDETQENNNANTNNEAETDETQETLSPEEELWGKDVKVEKTKTPYEVAISYPKDEMKVEEVKEDSNYQLDFYGTGKLKDFCVYSILFGSPVEDASLIGYLDSTPVFFYVYTDYSGYEDKLEDIYKLQEGVNNVIWEISQSENFAKEQ